MSLFTFPLLYTYLLIVLVAITFTADGRRLQQKNKKTSKLWSKDVVLVLSDEMNPMFAKELSEARTQAELVSVIAQKDRRFCNTKILKKVERKNRLMRGSLSGRNDTIVNQSMANLRRLCDQYKKGRTVHQTDLSTRRMRFSIKSAAMAEALKVKCQPEPTRVKVPFGNLYYPECVLLKRCGGCCGHPKLTCNPTRFSTVNKTVFDLGKSSEFDNIKTFPMEEHEECKCECQIKSTDCNKPQVYDANSCDCVCPNESESLFCSSGMEWDPKLCKCTCKKSVDQCSTGLRVHPKTCKCV